MQKTFLLLLSLALAAPPGLGAGEPKREGVSAQEKASSELVIDISRIAGRSPEEVAQILGEPIKEERSKHGPRVWYKANFVTIVYIDDKADWISVKGMDSVPFNAHAIETLGLKPEAPTFKNENVIRWDPHSTYKSVTIFPRNGKVDYAFVKAATK